MLSAYVLIKTEVGKVAHVAQAFTELEGVQLAEDLAGLRRHRPCAGAEPQRARPAGGVSYPGS